MNRKVFIKGFKTMISIINNSPAGSHTPTNADGVMSSVYRSKTNKIKMEQTPNPMINFKSLRSQPMKIKLALEHRLNDTHGVSEMDDVASCDTMIQDVLLLTK
eukprot:400228_1